MPDTKLVTDRQQQHPHRDSFEAAMDAFESWCRREGVSLKYASRVSLGSSTSFQAMRRKHESLIAQANSLRMFMLTHQIKRRRSR